MTLACAKWVVYLCLCYMITKTPTVPALQDSGIQLPKYIAVQGTRYEHQQLGGFLPSPCCTTLPQILKKS
jgi:hypothetical protein